MDDRDSLLVRLFRYHRLKISFNYLQLKTRLSLVTLGDAEIVIRVRGPYYDMGLLKKELDVLQALLDSPRITDDELVKVEVEI